MDRLKDHRYRQAVEDCIRNQASRKRIAPNVLRRRFALEVLAAGLCYTSPDRWMLKGGFALRTRLGDPARHSMDLDAEHRGGADAAMRHLQKLAAGPVAVPFRFELVGVEEVPEHGVARAVRALLQEAIRARVGGGWVPATSPRKEHSPVSPGHARDASSFADSRPGGPGGRLPVRGQVTERADLRHPQPLPGFQLSLTETFRRPLQPLVVLGTGQRGSAGSPATPSGSVVQEAECCLLGTGDRRTWRLASLREPGKVEYLPGAFGADSLRRGATSSLQESQTPGAKSFRPKRNQPGGA